MAQETITLRLDANDRVKAFNKDELLQIEAYKSANEQLNRYTSLSEQIAQKQQNTKWSENLTQPLERIHNAIFIDGAWHRQNRLYAQSRTNI